MDRAWSTILLPYAHVGILASAASRSSATSQRLTTATILTLVETSNKIDE